jgi:hypothetical protein
MHKLVNDTFLNQRKNLLKMTGSYSFVSAAVHLRGNQHTELPDEWLQVECDRKFHSPTIKNSGAEERTMRDTILTRIFLPVISSTSPL